MPSANPVECDYRAPGAEKGSLASFDASTNGLTEYTASNFGGAMDGRPARRRLRQQRSTASSSTQPVTAVVSSEPLFSSGRAQTRST